MTLMLALLVSAKLANAAPPNILFILADDQRTDTIGAYGNDHIKTPNLDRLVQQGFSFRNNYCMGSMHGAVCQPSRAMMLSGKAYFRIPMDLKGVSTLPQQLGKNGYTTFATGKWHNHKPALLKSFQQGKNVFLGGMSNHDKVPLVDIGADGSVINKRIGKKTSSELFADAAIEFLESQKETEDPFYAYVSMTAPHDPRQPSEKHRAYYSKNQPPLPENFMPQHPFDNGRLIVRDENLAAWPRTPEIVREQLAEYYGLISHMDDQIGRILEALEKTGKRENTIIVYAADHGLAMGSHGLLGKQNLYEHSMKAPLIFVGPGIPKGQSSTLLTYLFDITPTLFRSADVSMPDGMDGVDLEPVWSGTRNSTRSTLFTSYEDIQRAVRDDRWKLIRYPKIDHTQLFDLENDPFEMNDLAADKTYSKHFGRLMAEMVGWQQRLGDTAPLRAQPLMPKHKDLSGTPRKPDQHQPQWIVEKYFD
jgi:arylsulfatase A-like enzyme